MTTEDTETERQRQRRITIEKARKALAESQADRTFDDGKLVKHCAKLELYVAELLAIVEQDGAR